MKIMHATQNQSSIMQPQINTQEQSRVNQNPIVYMTNNNVLFGIHNALLLDFLSCMDNGQRWVRVTTAHLWTNKLPYMFRLNTLVNQASQP